MKQTPIQQNKNTKTWNVSFQMETVEVIKQTQEFTKNCIQLNIIFVVFKPWITDKEINILSERER